MWITTLLATVPPNWIAWIADLGSVFGFAATVILAVQAWQMKSKYTRLVLLSKHLNGFKLYGTDLFLLIDAYTTSDRAVIQRQVGTIMGDLTALNRVLSKKERQLVQPLLDKVRGISHAVTENALLSILTEIMALTRVLEDMVDRAKMDS